jgi:hypothetical protein
MFLQLVVIGFARWVVGLVLSFMISSLDKNKEKVYHYPNYNTL